MSEREEYWTKRAEEIFVEGEENALALAVSLKSLYDKALEEINNELYKFYGKYATEKGISLSQAKKLLNNNELRAYKIEIKKYIKFAKEHNFKKSEIQKLSASSIKSRISRLDELKTKIEFELDKLSSEAENEVSTFLMTTLEDNYYKNLWSISAGLGVAVSFNQLDKKTIEQAIMTKIKDTNFSTAIWTNKDKLVSIINEEIPLGLVLGYNPKKLAKKIEQKMSTNYNNTVRLVRTEYNLISNKASAMSYIEAGIEKYQLLATLDHRTSDICQEMDSKIFDVKDISIGINYPPFHPNCFDKETEVYTNNGWKLFKDLDKSDLIFTINPNTLIPEYEKPINYIKYNYKGHMISFKHKFFDLLVTPNHNMWVTYCGKDSSNKFRFVEAEKMPKWSNKIYRSCNWVGIEPKNIKLGDYYIDTELYCKFMAYYLADGSFITKNENNRGYRISISQTTYKDKLYNELKTLPVNLCVSKDGLYFSDKSIYEYLQQFGRSNEKYIPDEIKNLSPKYLQIFLDAYTITDGHKSKDNYWDGYKCKDSICYFSTSKRMADDLGELILKCNRRPTFKLLEHKDKPCFNNRYKQNYDLWIIYDNSSIWALTDNIKKEIIDYNDMVYCVELQKYNTLLVRRNGQICWCGNCRTTTIAYFEPDEFDENLTAVRKDKNGNAYEIPLDITYKEWQKLYGDIFD